MNTAGVVTVAAAAAAAVFFARRANAAQAELVVFEGDQLAYGEFEEPDHDTPYAPIELPTWLDNLPEIFMGSTASALPSDLADANIRAFLDTIAAAEGTLGKGDNGYNVLFGGAFFFDYRDHPRQAKQFTDRTGRRLWTSAAGRYQAMAISPIPNGGTTRMDTWDRIKAKVGLPDFSPASQDLFAIELIHEKGAYADVRAGRFKTAIEKCAPVWASFPGAGYAQPEQKLEFLTAAFQGAGGTITA